MFYHFSGVDDAESECGLDSVDDWDFILNNNNSEQLQPQVERLLTHIHSKLS